MFQRIGPAAIKKDLTNTIRLCEALGHPEQAFSSVHIAGTNGKGSVSNWLSAILQSSGHQTGLYTSPHLLDFRERIRINGVLCEEAFITDFVSRYRPVIEEIEPSFFEITVAMAFLYFAEKGVDIAVIETGLGGRLDSTNVITPVLGIITNIGWDHMAMLGNTLPLIASEKAGIIKPGVPVLIGERQEEVQGVFKEMAVLQGAPLYNSDNLVRLEVLSNDPAGLCFRAQLETTQFTLETCTPMFGSYQEKNLQTVLAAADLLQEDWQISVNDIISGLQQVKELTGFRGRMEILQHQPLVLADCAHNSDGLDQLRRSIDAMDVPHWHIVTGAVQDKDVAANLLHLPESASYYFCKPDIPRGMDARTLQQLAANMERKGVAYGSVHEAIVSALSNSGSDEAILICGSIFVVAEALPNFKHKT